MSRTARCKSCRWWERSNNFRQAERDWGLCHFWGGEHFGARIPNGFIDYTVGHEPRGADTCGFHNADPSLRGTVPASIAPKMKCGGEPSTPR